MQELLRAENLTKIFYPSGKEPVTAVDDVSLHLGEKEVLGLVGESGSGKSTIARLLTRLTDCSGGRISLMGQDITRVRGKKLRGIYREIQMVFQDPAGSFDPRRSLGWGIGESLKNSRQSGAKVRSRVEGLLEECGLGKEFADRYPHEVSGGECQRAAIARALAIEPKILICDEATSALDVTVQAQILRLLRELRETRQMSYLFISHNLALVEQFCDRVLVLRDGKVIESGDVKEVIRNPKSDYAKLLLSSVL